MFECNAYASLSSHEEAYPVPTALAREGSGGMG